jgi:predicted DNA binding CopG/RHH family protein
MKKHLQKMKTDEEVEKFLEGDLSDYLHEENFQRVTFEFVSQNPKQTILKRKVSASEEVK